MIDQSAAFVDGDLGIRFIGGFMGTGWFPINLEL